jgi:hypothetical protein
MLYDEDQRVAGFPEIAILSNEKVGGKFIGVVAAGDFGIRTSPTDARLRSRLQSALVSDLPKSI